MGARTRFFALRHLTKTSEAARHQQELPQLAVFAFDVISTSIMVDGRFEAEELDGLRDKVFPKLPAARVCLDIGANIGNHALFFAEHFETVLAFEPHPRTNRLLELNAELADNIKTFKVGLSDRTARLSASPVSGNLGMASIGRDAPANADAVEFDVVRLDDIAEIQNSESIDFIKIDVEGHELPALKGAEMTLRRHRPIIAMEVLKGDISDGTSEAMTFLEKLGYEHRYVLQSNRPFARAPRVVARLMTALIGLLFDRRPAKQFSLEPFDRLEVRNHPIVILSTGVL